jgi:hypothetical protein
MSLLPPQVLRHRRELRVLQIGDDAAQNGAALTLR